MSISSQINKKPPRSRRNCEDIGIKTRPRYSEHICILLGLPISNHTKSLRYLYLIIMSMECTLVVVHYQVKIHHAFISLQVGIYVMPMCWLILIDYINVVSIYPMFWKQITRLSKDWKCRKQMNDLPSRYAISRRDLLILVDDNIFDIIYTHFQNVQQSWFDRCIRSSGLHWSCG